LCCSQIAHKNLQELCPDVLAHFIRFPSFIKTESRNESLIPLQTSEFAARSVCTYSIVQRWLGSLNIKMYLHAGSHLGAIVHGQNIPWDDDVDGFVTYESIDKIAKMCDEGGIQVHPKVELNCKVAFNAVKIWLDNPEDANRNTYVFDTYGWRTPFVDLFFYKIIENNLIEVDPMGGLTSPEIVPYYKISDFFPTEPYYFGGIFAVGPPKHIAEQRYNLQKCKVGDWNHRVEDFFYYGDFIDCDKLKGVHPFVDYKTNMIVTTHNTQHIFPKVGTNVHPLTITSIKERDEWAIAPDSLTQNITNHIPNLDKVEIDNAISPYDECTVKGHLKVVEYNAHSGRWWQEGASLLMDADIIILNEIDIGMARSDQQHTTRLLAHFLGMNYAWGIEFIEVTKGNKKEREYTKGLPNFHGLTGNAFLTRCKIVDPIIYRVPVGKTSTEVRFGGRMGIFGRIVVNGKDVVVGSVNQLDGLFHEIRSYIGESKSVIGGGQTTTTFCKDVGLTGVLVSNHNKQPRFTSPASCNSFGTEVGDNICSNINDFRLVDVIKPCITDYNIEMEVSDHALTGASFKI
jgi:hypothetical protein